MQELGEVQLHLPLHRGGELRAPHREQGRARRVVRQVVAAKPLGREGLRQHVGARIVEHPVDLRRHRVRFRQLTGLGQGEERVVRHAAPQRVREAARELVAREVVRRRVRHVGVELHAVQELRRREHDVYDVLERAQRVDAELPRRIVFGQQALALGVVERPPIGALAERRDDLRSTGRVRRRIAGDDARAQFGVGEDRRADLARGDEVVLDLARAHGERRRDVVEAVRLLADEGLAQARIGVEEVPDGVVVLDVAEAVDGLVRDDRGARDGAAAAGRSRSSAAGAPCRARNPFR